MAIRSLLDLVTARLVCILLECCLVLREIEKILGGGRGASEASPLDQPLITVEVAGTCKNLMQ